MSNEHLQHNELIPLFYKQDLPATEPMNIYALRLKHETNPHTHLLLSFLKQHFGFPPPWDQTLQASLAAPQQ